MTSSTWNLDSSPFSSLIGTNHTPSSEELDRIKVLLVEPTNELSRLRLEIASLVSEIDKVEKYIQAHQTVISPIRRIPPELLAEIFVRCLPDAPYGVRSLEYAPLLLMGVCKQWASTVRETPLLWNSLHIHFPAHLSEKDACKRIAGIALWLERSATLPISLSVHGFSKSMIQSPYDFSAAATDSLLRAQAQRQRNMTLLIQTLLRFGDRFRDIHLCLSKEDLNIFNSLSPSSFPALVSFKVTDHLAHNAIVLSYEMMHPSSLTADGHPVEPPYAHLLARMPALQKLIINTIDRRAHYQTFQCDWASLTHVDLQIELTGVNFLRLLASTPFIRFIRVGICLETSLQQTEYPLATLTHLTSMRLGFISNEMPRGYYIPYHVQAAQGQAGVPNLDFFGLGGGGGGGGGGEDAGAANTSLESQMATIFSRIICSSLKSLHISQWSSSTMVGSVIFSKCPFPNLPLHALETLGLDLLITPEALMECLSLATSLTSLEVLDQGIQDDIVDPNAQNPPVVSGILQDIHLKRLTPSPENFDCLCPKLENFCLLDTGLFQPGQERTTWTTPVMTTFLESRASASSDGEIRPLRSCRLFFQSKRLFSATELATLRKLKKEGKMKLFIHISKAYEMPQDDGAMTGLFPPSPTEIRTFRDLDSMDDKNTDVVI